MCCLLCCLSKIWKEFSPFKTSQNHSVRWINSTKNFQMPAGANTEDTKINMMLRSSPSHEPKWHMTNQPKFLMWKECLGASTQSGISHLERGRWGGLHWRGGIWAAHGRPRKIPPEGVGKEGRTFQAEDGVWAKQRGTIEGWLFLENSD